MFESEHSNNSKLTWLLRFVGWLLMFIGLQVITDVVRQIGKPKINKISDISSLGNSKVRWMRTLNY